MSDYQKQIEKIEKEIRETPYHKGTEHHIGILRARISRLKDKIIEEEGRAKGGGGGGYAVKHQGDATIVLVGPPSVGKSTLLNALTNAKSKVAPYAFTTVSVIPGMMIYKNARIQILDVPGLIEGAEAGKGRGKEVLSVIRGCDLAIILTEIGKESEIDKIKKILEKNGIRLDKEKPDIKIEKKLEGGIEIHTNIQQTIPKNTIKEIIMEYGIKNCVITINEKLTIDRLIDSLSKNRVYLPSISVINKSDLISFSSPMPYLYVSAEKKINLNALKEEIWKKLQFITVYLVKEDQEPSQKNPLVVKKDTKLSNILEKLGSNISQTKKSAKIWGNGAKYPGQIVSLSTNALDGMYIRFI